MKMKGRLIFMPAVMLAFVVGCSDRIEPAGIAGDGTAEKKIINDGISQTGNVLMVYVSDCADAAAGIADAVSGVTSVEPLFSMETGDVALKKSLGLDRWLVVEFAEEADVAPGAETLSSLASVSSVEFNASVQRCADWRSWPYEPGPATRAIAAAGFNDPYRADQWGFENTGDKGWCPTARVGADINVSRAWSLCAGSPDVVVAVIDEAVQCDHPDLAANIWTNPGEIAGNGTDDDGNGYRDDIHGYNFVDGTPNLDWKSDGNSGHGTHVAGTVAAVNNNGLGVCGIAGGGSGRGDGVKIMSCQIFNRGKSSVRSVVKAFEYAADNGACIAQCSFGVASGYARSESDYASYGNRSEIDAIRYFLAKSNCKALDGGIAIFASGNDGDAMSGYPAALNDCISVCAVGADGLPAYYTNYGYGCNISAPGGDYYAGGKTGDMKGGILSTMPTQSINLFDEDGKPAGTSATSYGYMQGTSMACPHFSGVAALGLSYALMHGRHYTNDDFKSILLSSVSRIDNRLNGVKKSLVGTSIGNIMLNPYKGQMGSGVADVWRLYMQMDGVPSVMAETGKSQRIDISGYFGGGAPDLYYPDGTVEVSAEDSEALGLAEAPQMAYGKLRIYPTKAGCARITVHAVAGSTLPDGEEGLPGGMVMTRTISVISRPAVSDNGGWF